MFFQKSREKEVNGARSWRQILSRYLVEKATCCKGEQQGLIITKVTCLVLRAKVKKPLGKERFAIFLRTMIYMVGCPSRVERMEWKGQIERLTSWWMSSISSEAEMELKMEPDRVKFFDIQRKLAKEAQGGCYWFHQRKKESWSQVPHYFPFFMPSPITISENSTGVWILSTSFYHYPHVLWGEV